MYPVKKLREVGVITTGYTPSKLNKEFWGGNTLFIKPPHLRTDKIIIETEETLSDLGREKGKLIKKNSIMVCCIGSLGKIGIAGENVCTNQQINSIFFNDKIVNFKYGYYFCTTLEKLMNKIANKAIIAIINKTTFSEILIPLPPLSTQSRIVAKLDEAFGNIDKQIELLKGNIEDVENMKKSVLEMNFQNGEYEMKMLSDICNFKNGFAFKSHEFNENSNGLQVIRIGNVLDGNKNKVFIKQSNIFNEFMLKKFDIIVGMTGTRKKRDYLLPGIITDDNMYYLNQRVGRLRVLEDIADYKFLYFFLKTDHFRNKIFTHETGTVNQGNISGKDISNQLIPLPPLPRQQEIVAHLDAVFDKTRTLRSEYESQIHDLELLKQSLLEEAFAGRLVTE